MSWLLSDKSTHVNPTFPLGTWCWWCCHPCDTQVLHLPFKYDALRKRFETMGAFCSWGCMKAFNLNHNGVSKAGVAAQNILLMRHNMCGGITTPIRSAPNRYVLDKFGGTMTIEEFRSFGDTAPITSCVEETLIAGPSVARTTRPEGTSTTKMQNISNATASSETLKLKRTKPLKRDENNLEKSLGIIRKAK
jgi:hypothetical protein